MFKKNYAKEYVKEFGPLVNSIQSLLKEIDKRSDICWTNTPNIKIDFHADKDDKGNFMILGLTIKVNDYRRESKDV